MASLCFSGEGGEEAYLHGIADGLGSFQELWKEGWKPGDARLRLCIEIPTWEMRPSLAVPVATPEDSMTDYLREWGGQLMEEMPLTLPLRLQRRL